jgi:pyruvate dehydrogenase E1 component alpha subunit
MTQTSQDNPKADTSQTGDRPSAGLSAEKLLEMLRQMMVIRHFEERSAQSYQQAKIGGFCHLYIGQEATAVGSVAALRDDDPIITAYRDHGHALARGMHPNHCMAEMFGKVDGCAKGKGGSMHMFDRPNQMYGGHAIVAGQCPLGVGIAFAIQYNDEDKVCLCYLGDGALNQGAFHESMNLAAIWKLPILFVVENNMYSMGTHIARGTAMAEDLGKKAAAYGMRYAECNGLDALEVYDCFTREVSRARPSEGGEGPAFINAVTYRYQGHSMSDPQKYRTKEEVSEYEEQDCIKRLSAYLLEHELASQEQIDQFDEEAKRLSKEAVAFAEQSADLSTDELYTDVFVEPFPPFAPGQPHEAFRG